jgi:cysteine desulfurase
VGLKNFKEKKAVSFFFSTVDHACVVQLKDELEALGHSVFSFGVNRLGEFDVDELIIKIRQEQSIGHDTFMNFTYINNETGVVWPISLAEKIKKATNAFIHVDAVQLVGKISNWNGLSLSLIVILFQAINLEH